MAASDIDDSFSIISSDDSDSFSLLSYDEDEFEELNMDQKEYQDGADGTGDGEDSMANEDVEEDVHVEDGASTKAEYGDSTDEDEEHRASSEGTGTECVDSSKDSMAKEEVVHVEDGTSTKAEYGDSTDEDEEHLEDGASSERTETECVDSSKEEDVEARNEEGHGEFAKDGKKEEVEEDEEFQDAAEEIEEDDSNTKEDREPQPEKKVEVTPPPRAEEIQEDDSKTKEDEEPHPEKKVEVTPPPGAEELVLDDEVDNTRVVTIHSVKKIEPKYALGYFPLQRCLMVIPYWEVQVKPVCAWRTHVSHSHRTLALKWNTRQSVQSVSLSLIHSL